MLAHGWRAHDRAIQRDAREIEAREGKEAADKFEAQKYKEALGMQWSGFAGAGVGAAVGSVVPVVGTIAGAMIGGVIGVITGYNITKDK